MLVPNRCASRRCLRTTPRWRYRRAVSVTAFDRGAGPHPRSPTGSISLRSITSFRSPGRMGRGTLSMALA